MQRLIQQDAGVVTGKRPARAIGAMHPWRQSHYQETRVGSAEWRDWFTVIVRIALVYGVEKLRQARARATVPVENCLIQARTPRVGPS